MERPAAGFEALSGACSLERPAEGFEGFERFEGGQTAVLNALKNRWLGPAVALLWKGFRKSLKHCLGHVAARVALERPAGSCNFWLGKACGRVSGV